MWGPNSQPTAGYDRGCLGVAGELSFERGNCAIEDLVKHPALPLDNLVRLSQNRSRGCYRTRRNIQRKMKARMSGAGPSAFGAAFGWRRSAATLR
jgi:hypothetical protein